MKNRSYICTPPPNNTNNVHKLNNLEKKLMQINLHGQPGHAEFNGEYLLAFVFVSRHTLHSTHDQTISMAHTRVVRMHCAVCLYGTTVCNT